MADVNRLTVDYLVLHHAVTPQWSNKSKPELAQWFSDNGFARAYGSNPNNWSGLINPYTGGRSYSQAQFAGQIVDSTTPDATDAERIAGYRLVQLVDDVWGQICWHAGNWEVNRASIGIECLGDYRNYTLRDGDCRVIAAFWRPQDQKLGGATAIVGHYEVSQSSTSCPARIMEMRDTIVNYVNNPPLPVVTTKDETSIDSIPFEINRIPDSSKFVGDEVNVQDGVNGSHTIVTRITYTDGIETNRSIISDKTVPSIAQVIYYGTKPIVSTTEPPQEEVTKQPSENTETSTNPSQEPEAPVLNQTQGRFSKLWGIIVSLVMYFINKLKKS